MVQHPISTKLYRVSSLLCNIAELLQVKSRSFPQRDWTMCGLKPCGCPSVFHYTATFSFNVHHSVLPFLCKCKIEHNASVNNATVLFAVWFLWLIHTNSWILLLSSTWKGISTSCTWKDGASKHPTSDPQGQRLSLFVFLFKNIQIYKTACWWASCMNYVTSILMRVKNLVENLLLNVALNDCGCGLVCFDFKCGWSTESTTSKLVLTAIAVFIFPGLFAGWDRC